MVWYTIAIIEEDFVCEKLKYQRFVERIMMLNKFFDKTFLKFIIVGIINTLFGTAIMFCFYNFLNCSYWFSSAANYVLGSILSYFLNKYFTFKNTDKGFKTVFKFTINILVCYFLAYGIAKPLVVLILSSATQKIQENLAMLVGMCFFVGFNYIGQRFFAFKQ